MLKNLLLLSLLVISLSINAMGYQWEYNFDKPVISDGKVYMSGCDANLKAGDPSVAIKQVRLLLPYNQKAVNMEVTYSQPITLEGTYLIDPVAVSGRLSVTPPANLSRFSVTYNRDEFYPAAPKGQKFVNQYKNGHTFLISMVYPMQYNPITQKIQYFTKISVNITTEFSTNDNYRQDTSIARSIRALANNPEMVDTYPMTERTFEDYDYLIITSPEFADNFTEFVTFNLNRCLKTKIVSLPEINTVSGFDQQDKIRNYIREQYQQYGITYVLLAGDDEILPHRGFRSEINDYGTDYYNETDMPADMYFSCLDGTWKVAGSQYFGETGSEDLLWEVYTARFAVDSETELNNLIHKTIFFSQNPVIEEVTNNLLVGEFLWGPPQFEIETWGQMYMDELIGFCDANGYTSNGFTPEWSNTTLYDNDAYWDGNTLIQTVRDNKIVWIDHLGHSNVTYNMQLYSNQVTSTNFNNNGVNANYFMVYSQGCYSGSFDNRDSNGQYLDTDCIGEKFTTISNGAVAYVGNSRYGLGSPYDTNGAGQVFHRYFHEALFNQNIHSVEMMNAYSKEVSAAWILEPNINLAPYYGECKWIAYNLNVLGDPALSIWSTTPQYLNPVVPDSMLLGDYSEIVSVPYTKLAFVVGDSVFTDVIDSTGIYYIAGNWDLINLLVNNPNHFVEVKLKADNYLPYETVITYTLGNNDVVNKPCLVSLKNYPNPFNPETTISFELRENAQVELTVFNIKGQKVTTLAKGNYTKGINKVVWNGMNTQNKSVSGGVYFYKLTINDKESLLRKTILLK